MNIGEHEKIVEKKQGKAKRFFCFSSVHNVKVFFIIIKKHKRCCLIDCRNAKKYHVPLHKQKNNCENILSVHT